MVAKRFCVRRRFLIGSVAAALLVPALSYAQTGPSVIVVSRERMLRDVEAARVLAETERRYTAILQSKIDEANETFAAEETGIADERATLSPEQLSDRIADFDRRMRLWRRTAQERAGVLQRGFQEARAQIVASLPTVLEELRRETGADVVVNADQVLAVGPGLDATARAVELFNKIAPPPVIPEIDMNLPLIVPEDGETGAASPSEQ